MKCRNQFFLLACIAIQGCATHRIDVSSAQNESPVKFAVRLSQELSSGIGKLIVGSNTNIYQYKSLSHLNLHFIPSVDGTDAVRSGFLDYCTKHNGEFLNGVCFATPAHDNIIFISSARNVSYNGNNKYVEVNVTEPMPNVDSETFLQDSLSVLKGTDYVVRKKKSEYSYVPESKRRWRGSVNAWAEAIVKGNCDPFDTLCAGRYHYLGRGNR